MSRTPLTTSMWKVKPLSDLSRKLRFGVTKYLRLKSTTGPRNPEVCA